MNRQYWITINGFARFLRERCIKHAFIINLYKRFGKHYSGETSIRKIYEYSKDIGVESFIDHALIWEDTIEGFDFWNDAHEDFIELLNGKTI